MQGDFTRDTFDPRKHFLRVLMQQGRVQLDADFNEQVAILLHYMQTLAADLIGPWGGPGVKRTGTNRAADEGGFNIAVSEGDLSISPGRYYVDGILCENEQLCWYLGGKDRPRQQYMAAKALPTLPYLVYLDVWERHVNEVEDRSGIKDGDKWLYEPRIPGIREVALGGPDTTTRTKVVWQVKAQSINLDDQPWEGLYGSGRTWGRDVRGDFLGGLVALNILRPGTGKLKARARVEDVGPDPCITAPDARYRGAENQLYRVEIHRGSDPPDGPTFKWSRENGSVIFPIVEFNGDKVTLEHLGRDERFSLKAGDWVELLDDDTIWSGGPGNLYQVDKVDHFTREVTLTKANAPGAPNLQNHPYLRRWDQHPVEGSGVINVNKGTGDAGWIELEDGVEIQFEQSERGGARTYRPGDYWLIPARTATGDVEWPQEAGGPKACAPHGIEHHYAPLAIVEGGGPIDLRCLFGPYADPAR